jgi:hypothetical protein
MSDLKSSAMRRCIQSFAVWLLVTGAVAANAQTPKFDGRAWTVGHQQSNERQSITEYVLPGQTVDNWKEMVTSEVFFQPMPIPAFVERTHASLARGCPSLDWTVIRQDEKTAVIEWRDSGCGGFEPSSELARYTIDEVGLYRLAYTVKGTLQGERRKQWMAVLGQTPLAEETARKATTRDAQTGAKDPEQAARMAKATQVLVGFMRQSGQPCSPPAKAELKDQIPGPAGPLTEWLLECSDGRYSVLVQPNGSMTAFPARK